MSLRQRTLGSQARCVGIGLHSGAQAKMTLHPAPAGSGILFRRVDLPGAPEVPATWKHAAEMPLCSGIARDTASVMTIEHLMAAFYGCGIDNVRVDLDGPEVPAMDGSAAPFLSLIDAAGVVEQAAPRRAVKILKSVSLEDEGRKVSLTPHDGFKVRFEIDFDTPLAREQRIEMPLTPACFRQEIAEARTFGFLEDVTHLRSRGLARGGSLDNAVVIDGARVLNEGGLRFADEFVRHKVLDSIGDLYLAGGPLLGFFEGFRAGHMLTLRLLQRLFADEQAWTWCELPADREHEAASPAQPLRAVAQHA